MLREAASFLTTKCNKNRRDITEWKKFCCIYIYILFRVICFWVILCMWDDQNFASKRTKIKQACNDWFISGHNFSTHRKLTNITEIILSRVVQLNLLWNSVGTHLKNGLRTASTETEGHFFFQSEISLDLNNRQNKIIWWRCLYVQLDINQSKIYSEQWKNVKIKWNKSTTNRI